MLSVIGNLSRFYFLRVLGQLCKHFLVPTFPLNCLQAIPSSSTRISWRPSSGRAAAWRWCCSQGCRCAHDYRIVFYFIGYISIYQGCMSISQCPPHVTSAAIQLPGQLVAANCGELQIVLAEWLLVDSCLLLHQSSMPRPSSYPACSTTQASCSTLPISRPRPMPLGPSAASTWRMRWETCRYRSVDASFKKKWCYL